MADLTEAEILERWATVKNNGYISHADKIAFARALLASRWLPISECPRDGTKVLLCGTPEEDGRRSIETGKWSDISDSWLSGGGWFEPDEVTHFQYLPQPPTT